MTGSCRTLLKEKALAHSWHFLRNPDMEKKKRTDVSSTTWGIQSLRGHLSLFLESIPRGRIQRSVSATYISGT